MAKSKRSKHMRAMRKILREKLSKKDDAKRIASMKDKNLVSITSPKNESIVDEKMLIGESTNSEYNIRTMKNKDGQYPGWLSGRQRKRFQTKEAARKRNEKNKKKGKVTKRKAQSKKVALDKPEAMSI